jgi:hypothetical protein
LVPGRQQRTDSATAQSSGGKRRGPRLDGSEAVLILECKPGCYTLVGKERDERGQIVDPVRVEWKPNSVFVTPPGH